MDALSHILPSLGIEAEHLLAWLALFASICTVLGWALDWALPRLREYAASTATTADDRVVDALERLHVILGFINVIIPRLGFGQRHRFEDDDDA